MGREQDRSGRDMGSPELSERIELSGRVRTATSCIEWRVAAVAGCWQAVLRDRGPSDGSWSSYEVEGWDEDDNVTYAIEVVFGERFPSEGVVALPGQAYIWQNVPPVAVCEDGLVVDVPASTSTMRIRVLGILSRSRSPELWQDDELPTIDGNGPRASQRTDDFWFGVFAD